jgi:hypothetical protein
MYQVFKNNNRSLRTKFTTYGAARAAVRKLIRKTVNRFWLATQPDPTSPNIGDFGYSIRKV